MKVCRENYTEGPFGIATNDSIWVDFFATKTRKDITGHFFAGQAYPEKMKTLKSNSRRGRRDDNLISCSEFLDIKMHCSTSKV